MYKSKCKRCKTVFAKNYEGKPYGSQTQADVALRMHIGRVHTHSIPNASGRVLSRALRLSHRNRAKEAVMAGNGQTKSPSLLAQVLELPETSRVDRRTKAYRSLRPRPIAEHKPRHAKAEEGDALCFCPRCGLNLAVAKTALIVALRHS